jgi:hypothetical protein
MTKGWLLRITALLAALAYPVLGWCPPPPGVLIPDGKTYDFGNVVIGATGRVSINLLLNPAFSSFGTVIVSDVPPAFYFNEEGAFAVDPIATTCVPGTPVTTTTGCTLVVTFAPSTVGAKVATWLSFTVCTAGPLPPCPGRTTGSTSSFTGNALALPVPTLSPLLLVACAACLCLVVAFGRSRRQP